MNPICLCKHTWEDHHHGCVLNEDYYGHPLVIRGCMAQECEYNQRYGIYTPKKGEKACKCPNFKPKSKVLQDKVAGWRKSYEKS